MAEKNAKTHDTLRTTKLCKYFGLEMVDSSIMKIYRT